jgi:hypothetical protein
MFLVYTIAKNTGPSRQISKYLADDLGQVI